MDVKTAVMMRYSQPLYSFSSNDFTLHRSDQAAVAIPLKSLHLLSFAESFHFHDRVDLVWILKFVDFFSGSIPKNNIILNKFKILESIHTTIHSFVPQHVLNPLNCFYMNESHTINKVTTAWFFFHSQIFFTLRCYETTSTIIIFYNLIFFHPFVYHEMSIYPRKNFSVVSLKLIPAIAILSNQFLDFFS